MLNTEVKQFCYIKTKKWFWLKKKLKITTFSISFSQITYGILILMYLSTYKKNFIKFTSYCLSDFSYKRIVNFTGIRRHRTLHDLQSTEIGGLVKSLW